MALYTRTLCLFLAVGMLAFSQRAAFAQGPLTNGENHAGAISTPGEVDTWTVTLSKDDLITVSIGEVLDSEVDPGFVPWIRLIGPTGVQYRSHWGVWAAQITHVAPLSGTYTVLVASADIGNDALGSYQLTLATTPGSFIVPEEDEGGPLTNGVNHDGFIHVGDLDQWSISAAKGDTITVSIGEVLEGEVDPGFVPWIRLVGPTGVQYRSHWGVWAAQITHVAPLSGTYTVIVSTADIGNDSVGRYRLTLAKAPGGFSVPEDDEGGALTNSANHEGVIHVGDLDQWSITAAKDDTITVSIGEVLEGEVDPGFVPWIRLVGPTGVQYRSHWGVWAAQFTQVAPLSGTYTVIVSTADIGNDSVGRYRLTLAKVPGAFVVPEGDHGGPMANMVQYSGTIGTTGPQPELVPGDLDVWTFNTTQNRTVVVSIGEVLIGEEDPGFVPWIRLLSPTGVTLGSTWGTLAAQLTRVAPLSGTYTVVVGTADIGNDATGHYQLSVTGADPPPIPPTAANDSFSTLVNMPLSVPPPGVLANDNSHGSNPTTAVLVTTVSNGALTLHADGSFLYTPPAAFAGTVTFTYRAVNPAGPGNVATVTIGVSSQPPPVPTTVGDAYQVQVGTSLTVAAPGVLANDSGNGGAGLFASLVTAPSHGVLTLEPAGGFTYTPAAGFAGSDVFTYRAVTTAGPGNAAVVTILVASSSTPTALYPASIVGNVVTLRWTPPVGGPPPTGYVLEGGINPGETLASFPTGSAAPLFTFTAPTGVFHVRIKAVSSAGLSAPSNDVRIVVNVPEAPSAPEHLVGLVNNTALTLAWRNTFGGGTPGSIVLDVTGAATLSIPLGLTDTFSFVGVPGGTYTFAVRAGNTAGFSAPSNSVTLTFPGPCSGAPLPPARFLAYAVGNTITVMWDPAASGPAPTQYVLEVSGAFGGTFATPARTLSGTVGPGIYHLRVSAVNPCGTSAPTGVQTVTIP